MSRKHSAQLAGAAAVCAFVVGVLFGPDIEIRQRGLAKPAEAQSNSASGRSVAEQMSEAFEAASNKVSPSVVPIYAEKKVEVSQDMNEFYRRFFGQDMPDDENHGGGSGDD